MGRKEKLLAEWVKRGDLPPEALTSRAGHGRVDRNAPANRVPVEEQPFPVDDPVMEIRAEAVHGNGRRPEAKRVVRPQAEQRASVVPIILGVVANVCIVLTVVVVYLYYSGY